MKFFHRHLSAPQYKGPCASSCVYMLLIYSKIMQEITLMKQVLQDSLQQTWSFLLFLFFTIYVVFGTRKHIALPDKTIEFYCANLFWLRMPSSDDKFHFVFLTFFTSWSKSCLAHNVLL